MNRRNFLKAAGLGAA
ncbi:MAG: twin-arginine translocation signal domain-containing protein, partial [Planctomycetota bacterium]